MVKAVFAGTFDPPTFGHLDIIRRSLALFDRVHVVVGVNRSKAGLFTAGERLDLLRESCAEEGLNLARIVFGQWDGLIADYAHREGCAVLARGVRNFRDFEYEKDMAMYNARLAPGLETVFLPSDPRYVELSSSAVRELHAHRRLLDGLVPGPVRTALEALGRDR